MRQEQLLKAMTSSKPWLYSQEGLTPPTYQELVELKLVKPNAGIEDQLLCNATIDYIKGKLLLF